jgi:hypothetical protein
MRRAPPNWLRLLTLLIPALLAACSTPHRPPVVVRDSAPFPGIASLVQNSGGRPLDVILVHGMCTHDAAWANHGIDSIAGVVSANVPEQAAASANGIQLIERTQQIGNTPVRFHALVWSPLTAPLKRQLDYDNTGTPSDCSSAGAVAGECRPKRAWLNGYVKDRLLNDCLSDAVIYEGASRVAIRDAMVESISRILESNPNGDRTLAVVAESLGSKILFDALSAMLESRQPRTQALGQQAARRLGLLFMAGNQLPILGLAEQDIEHRPDNRSATAPDALQRFLELRRRQSSAPRAESVARLAVIAFTDPNDLLSYRLLPARYAASDVAVADVLASNDRTWLGLIENPVPAHLDYLANPDVAGMIACGYPRAANCR